MCPQQYFIEYILGFHGASHFKAIKGSAVHKILEIFGKIKLAKQQNQLTIDDDICGSLIVKELDTIEGQQKHLQTLTEKVYNHYIKGNTTHNWETQDFQDCKNWVNKTLDFNDGAFNPINQNIISPEAPFDIEIMEQWAIYDYHINNKHSTGFLHLKGTIDLLIKSNDDCIELIDYKTGRRFNWATGEEKTHEKLKNDPQLRIYHYAVHKLFPEIDQVIVTILYINDGGPFSICFSKDDLPYTLELIKNKFEQIKNTQKPALKKSWMCSRLCFAGKNTFEGTSIKPMIEFRNRQVCTKGEKMTICEQCLFELEKRGMDKVIQEYTQSGHTIGHYQNPGE